MSRIANQPVVLPKGVDVTINGQDLTVKGGKGSLNMRVHDSVSVAQEDSELQVRQVEGTPNGHAMSGTVRALLANMVKGTTEGWQKKLTLVGVGYRAQVSGGALNLTLGFSHPVAYPIPDGISIECPSQTEIVVSGINKQVVGQVASEIRAYRPPEPYKGKGVRYSDEQVVRKEAKKK